MQAHFIDLLEYNHHVNQKVLALLLVNLDQVSGKSQKLINHLINAQQIWNARILKNTPFEVWQINPWPQLTNMDNENYQNSLKIVNAFDLNTKVQYTNSKGEVFSNSINDVLYHIINHSTYHRAQIASDLKQNGIEPLNTDYIFYKRKTEL